MNDTPQNAWFYSREGERIGPVTFSELRVKASEAGINPRLDLIWTEGMAEWKPAGEIDGLFDRRSVTEPRETLSPAADPYAPPQQESSESFMANQGEWPGARRRSFLIATLLFPFIWAFGFGLATPLLQAQFGPEIMAIGVIGGNLIPFIVGLYFGLNRLVNLGMSRWWYLGNFVPILNFWVGYRCFACPAGYAFHKKLDGPGVFLAIVYWLMIAMVLVAAVAVVALLFGTVGTPEIQQQIREAIRAVSALNA